MGSASILLTIAALCLGPSKTANVEAPSDETPPNGICFRVHLDPAVAKEAVSGRLLVFLTDNRGGQPRLQIDKYRQQYLFGVDVEDLEPGSTWDVDDSAAAYPEPPPEDQAEES